MLRLSEDDAAYRDLVATLQFEDQDVLGRVLSANAAESPNSSGHGKERSSDPRTLCILLALVAWFELGHRQRQSLPGHRIQRKRVRFVPPMRSFDRAKGRWCSQYVLFNDDAFSNVVSRLNV